jgi:hypothetical protein
MLRIPHYSRQAALGNSPGIATGSMV